MKSYKIEINGIISTEDKYLIGLHRIQKLNDYAENVKEDDNIINNLILSGVIPSGSKVCVIKGMNVDTTIISTVYGVMTDLQDKAQDILLVTHGVWMIIPAYDKVLKITLTGDYQNLFTTWKKAYEYIDDNDLIYDAYANPWEEYVISYDHTDNTEELITHIYVPLISVTE